MFNPYLGIFIIKGLNMKNNNNTNNFLFKEGLKTGQNRGDNAWIRIKTNLEPRGRYLGVHEELEYVCAVVGAFVTHRGRDEREASGVVVLFASDHHQQATSGGVERQRPQPLRV